MGDPQLPLTPDEESLPGMPLAEAPPAASQPESQPDSPEASQPASQPYDVAAFMVGLLAFAILAGVFHRVLVPTWHLIAVAVFLMVVADIALELRRVRLPLVAMGAVAAVLGLWYSLPQGFLYEHAWLSPTLATLLALLTACAGALGLLVARSLHVTRHPYQVLAICFLGVFVTTHLIQLLVPVLLAVGVGG